MDRQDQRRRPLKRTFLQQVCLRPQEGRSRDEPQGARRSRRLRRSRLCRGLREGESRALTG